MRMPVVMWFRRDLRLADLPALHAAAAEGPVVPLFVVDPTFTGSGAPRRAFMAAALRSLDQSMGGALVYRHGDPIDVVPALAAEVGASAVFVTRDHGPYGRRRDAAVADRLRSDDRHLRGVGTNYAVTPGTVEKAAGGPYGVFTPFSRAWRSVGWDAPLGVPEVTWHGAPTVRCDGPVTVAETGIDDESQLGLATEATAHARWERFLPDAARYDDVRDLPAVDGTSRLSAPLRWGVVHPRQLLDDLDHSAESGGHRVLANELAWREFYADVLLHHPDSGWRNLDRRMDAMPVDRDAAAQRRFERWASGTTGYPIVDAGMRQLARTGWMHNRLRMLVASFLVKDLHLPWQWGARHFMAHLLDGDLASNSHGWQWTAGTGTDAAPYFRVFNPTTQALRFDPDGEFVRRWVPELAALEGGAVHAPGARRPEGYPAPMVDHAVEREEALRRLKSLSSGAGTR